MKILDWFKKNRWLVIIIVVAAVLRFYHADYQSMWIDEVLTMLDTDPKLSFKQFYDSVLLWEAFPHLYFLLVKYFMAIFGYSTMAARVFSALIGIFGVYGMYLFGKELHSRRVGLFAAAITCVSIYHIGYSQEARPYGMFFLFTALSFYRLVVLVKRANTSNALWFGLFTGLMINSHFFGLLTLASQGLFLLFLLIKQPAAERLRFFRILSLAAGIILVAILVTYPALVQIANIKSFWIPKPGPEVFTTMFKEFFGNAELLIYLVNALILYYLIRVFGQKIPNASFTGLINNRLVFGFVLLFSWLMVSLTIPIVKSYLDVPMLLGRYFVNVLPVFIIAIAIGADEIQNRFARNIVVFTIVLFSLLDLFVVKNYYKEPSKCQLRELAEGIKSSNRDHAKLVTYYTRVFQFYLQDPTMVIQEGLQLEDYVKGLRNGTIGEEPFWYASVNPYNLNPDDEAYLKAHFNQSKSLKYFDAWANYYKPKNGTKPTSDGYISLKTFQRANFDGQGNILLHGNSGVFTSFMDLQKGNYELSIKSKGTPSGVLLVKGNGKQIGKIMLSDTAGGSETVLNFVNVDPKIRLQIFLNAPINANATIYSLKAKKK